MFERMWRSKSRIFRATLLPAILQRLYLSLLAWILCKVLSTYLWQIHCPVERWAMQGRSHRQQSFPVPQHPWVPHRTTTLGRSSRAWCHAETDACEHISVVKRMEMLKCYYGMAFSQSDPPKQKDGNNLNRLSHKWPHSDSNTRHQK